MKKLLLIMPSYFGYEQLIENQLLKRSVNCVLINENLEYSIPFFKFLFDILDKLSLFLDKGSKKVIFGITKYIANLYYRTKLNKVNFSEIDTVLIIKGYYISEAIIMKMKGLCKNRTKFILYEWDSVTNNPNSVVISKLFDKVLTFDYKDSIQYGWQYRPLFFNQLSNYDSQKKDIDFLALCSNSPERVKILNSLKKYCEKENLKYFIKIFRNISKFRHLITVYLNKYQTLQLDPLDNYIFKPIGLLETNDLYNRSKVVVDFSHPTQSGFTMRTIETIGGKCKLLTNNKEIINADFYNKNNIYVYDDDSEILNIPEAFIKSEYVEYSPEIYYKYSLDGFLDEIFVE